MMVAPARYQILAIVYSDGIVADRMISDLGYRIRDAGIAVAGIVQHNKFVRDRTKCDMEVEELASGTVLQISEDRGEQARGCRLDRGALLEAAGLLSSSLESEPDLLIINKFGKFEAEGRGLRETLSEAMQLGVPIVVGVPYRNIEQWRCFAGGLAEECPMGSSRLHEWLSLHGFDLSRRPESSAPAGDDVNRRE
jgi:nucleoside-triphosphatase THEP1